MPTPDRDALDWLEKFAVACRGRDFDTGRRMFAQDAVAFGAWAMALHGLENIEREQWRNVWPRIRGFTFEPDPVVRAEGDTAWIAASWHSEATGPDGRLFTRPGRATFILARGDGAGSACTATSRSSPLSPSRRTAGSARRCVSPRAR